MIEARSKLPCLAAGAIRTAAQPTAQDGVSIEARRGARRGGGAMVGEGRGIGDYGKDQIVFAQGDPADAVFYILRGKVKVTVVSEQGKEAVVAMLGTNDFFG